MKKWLRAGEMNKNLVIALVVLVIGAGLFYGWKCRSASKVEDEFVSELTPDNYKLFDTETGETYLIPAAEAKTLEKNEEGMVKVPATGKFTGQWGGGKTRDIIDTEEEEEEKP